MLGFLSAMIGGLWLVSWLCRRFTRARRPMILTHRLSDRSSLVYVEKDGQFWVGTFTETELPREEEQPDWYRSITNRRN